MRDGSPVTYSLRDALFAQFGGLLAITGLVVGLARLGQVDPRPIALILALLQGGIAAMIAQRQHAPPWWLGIHLAFIPLVVFAQGLDIAPGWFLALFLLLLAIFWRTDKSRVPLYLTNRATAAALIQLLPAGPQQIIDIGCGDGGLLRQLALARPDCRFVGIEHAPLTWLVARLRTLGLTNVSIRYGNFWAEPLGGYCLVYAFLSPAPMSQLWEKLRLEMAAETLFISNGFAVPGVVPTREIAIPDRRHTRLYLYKQPPSR
jgi:hypothetical protein